MELKLEIICKNFEHREIRDKKINVDEMDGEYYIIPVSIPYDTETDGEVYRLKFENQLLWLKYSNHKKEILLKEYNYSECVLIKSEDILDIYVHINSTNCFRKNVWQTNNRVSLSKKYSDKYFLVLPIIEDMIDISATGEGIKYYNIDMLTNEILMKKTVNYNNHACYLFVSNNFLLNKDALFIRLNDDDVESFLY